MHLMSNPVFIRFTQIADTLVIDMPDGDFPYFRDLMQSLEPAKEIEIRHMNGHWMGCVIDPSWNPVS